MLLAGQTLEQPDRMKLGGLQSLSWVAPLWWRTGCQMRLGRSQSLSPCQREKQGYCLLLLG
jgi:hypothetical protein